MADRRAFLREARVDDLGVVGVADRTVHAARILAPHHGDGNRPRPASVRAYGSQTAWPTWIPVPPFSETSLST